MEELKKLLIELENKIPNQELLNSSVSKSCVGWHIEHILLTMNLVIESIHKSNPDNYKRNFNLNRFIVFTLNKIPRGKVKAPRPVRPQEDFTTNSLIIHLEKGKNNFEKLSTLSANNYFEHPFMGQLNLKQTIRFIKIHTKHHLNIINEIIESKNSIN
jgi:beta-mannanase